MAVSYYAAASLGVQSANLYQLRQLNNQLWMQQAEEQQQRYLSDVLLGVTQGVERIQRTVGKDQLAAGILAHRWLQITHWVDASMFSDFDRKERWQHCYGVLSSARDRLWANAQLAEKANQYLRIEDRLVELRSALGPDPKNTVAAAFAHQRSEERGYRSVRMRLPILVGLTGILTLVVAAVRSPALLMLLWLVAGAILVALMSSFFKLRVSRVKAAQHASHLHALRGELEQLHATGTPILERVCREHPFLMYVPNSEPPPRQAPIVEKLTIERQVVVARCKYCAQLTPVDHPRCAHCGGDRPV